ncbi:dihydrodipicolinate synthase family protein [Elioraea sp.]|uniref:dihydrodipicolinate synthase family protein n=1 Tax=Elioraea sp. TaxID=2185103 RepID=UPI0021DE967C|nr:dihydrodipicolinate synthase family protein [Elioraea sp.]GIX08324.1 MAG: dihydrodipicolinate synthase family protein [Elioraea sp.]
MTMLDDAIYGGVNAAVLTPMTPDLAPDIALMAEHCRWLLANGCDGLGVLGTTGEANSFSVAERIAVMEGLVEAGIPAAKMMPGTGCAALTDSVELTRRAKALGCPGVLMLPPFYYKNPTEDGLFAWFSEVIQRVGGGIKIYLYHFPQQSAVPISLGLIGRLMRAFPGTIKGVKDSSGDYANMKAMIDAFGGDGFEVYSGSDEFLLRILREGGAGCITAAANVNCTAGGRVVAAFRRGDEASAEAAQAVLTATRKVCTSVPLIAGLREIVARATGNPGWRTIRPPNMPLRAEQVAPFLAAFDATGIGALKQAA